MRELITLDAAGLPDGYDMESLGTEPVVDVTEGEREIRLSVTFPALLLSEDSHEDDIVLGCILSRSPQRIGDRLRIAGLTLTLAGADLRRRPISSRGLRRGTLQRRGRRRLRSVCLSSCRGTH